MKKKIGVMQISNIQWEKDSTLCLFYKNYQINHLSLYIKKLDKKYKNSKQKEENNKEHKLIQLKTEKQYRKLTQIKIDSF